MNSYYHQLLCALKKPIIAVAFGKQSASCEHLSDHNLILEDSNAPISYVEPTTRRSRQALPAIGHTMSLAVACSRLVRTTVWATTSLLATASLEVLEDESDDDAGSDPNSDQDELVGDGALI